MQLEKLFSDNKYLNKEIEFYISKKQIKKIEKNKELIEAHIEKAKHNIAFYKLNKEQTTFNDWLIVMLYYALYHCALALITNKEFSSKNHYATILILIKEYNITREEAELINELSINKEDAELYTNLKRERQNASYTTNTKFNNNTIRNYEEKVITFINKTKEIIYTYHSRALI